MFTTLRRVFNAHLNFLPVAGRAVVCCCLRKMHSIALLAVLFGALQAASAHPFLRVALEKQKTPDTITCPDEKSQCSDGYTCCPNLQGSYSCCGGLNAVCCCDGVHCCDEGYECDTAENKCTKPAGLGSDPIIAELLTMVTPSSDPKPKIPPRDVCADGRSCNASSTCCQGSSGEFACCSAPNAVCCQDFKHCCPEGFECGQDSCVKKFPAVSTNKKSSRGSIVPSLKDITCYDNTECPDGDTCCYNPRSSLFGCCPLQLAVCCSDGSTCCPCGTYCSGSDCLTSSPMLPLEYTFH